MGIKCKNDFFFDCFMETSAKDGINTKELFINCAKILYEENQSLLKEMNGDKIKDNTKINFTLDKSDIYEETEQCNCWIIKFFLLLYKYVFDLLIICKSIYQL